MENTQRIEFTREMKKSYTILLPNMAQIHFSLLERVFRQYGYRTVLLQNDGHSIVEKGLKYVHNDTCYPALLVIGQFLDALESGSFDPHKAALMITQTGGGCRASNYIHLLRKALEKAGFGYVPVISLNLSGLEKNSGFRMKPSMVLKMLSSLLYADLLMLLKNQVKPYEIHAGDADALTEKWITELIAEFESGRGYFGFKRKRLMPLITKSFAEIPVSTAPKIKVGVVGEIYVKYSPLANNRLEEFLLEQNCEVIVPGLLGFILFKTDNRLEDIRLYGGNQIKKLFVTLLLRYLTGAEETIDRALRAYGSFTAPLPYAEIKELVAPIIGHGCKMGEGWLLTAEMAELLQQGCDNIVCAQPFGCLPNHIVGKGMIRRLREIYRQANIVPIDYDPGATKVNQENRIKLMLAVAGESAAEVPEAADIAR